MEAKNRQATSNGQAGTIATSCGCSEHFEGRLPRAERITYLTRASAGPIYPASTPGVRWQSGDAPDCKSENAGSIPARTSNFPVWRPAQVGGDVAIMHPTVKGAAEGFIAIEQRMKAMDDPAPVPLCGPLWLYLPRCPLCETCPAAPRTYRRDGTMVAAANAPGASRAGSRLPDYGRGNKQR